MLLRWRIRVEVVIFMFIGILLGSPEINGGTYVIYEHGSRLKQRGHRVVMITREQVEPRQYAWHPAASKLEWLVIEEAEKLIFDVIMATWWQSAFLLHKFTATHTVYFVQSIESRFFAPENPADHDTRDNGIWKQLCESTYSYAVPMITEARWIKKYLYEKFNVDARLVPNGIRKDIYKTNGKAEASRQNSRLRVLVEGPVDVFYKNVPKAIELCRRAGVDDVWLMTSSEISAYPGADRVFSCIPIERTAEIYRSCDLLVKLSYVEGMFGPPLEMFHCGGTAIVYDVTGHDEYIRDGENSYVVKRDDEDRVVELLERLRKDHGELQRLKTGALKTAGNWPDWQEASMRFEEALGEIHTAAPQTNRHYLQRYTGQLWDDNQNRLDAKELRLFSRREVDSRNTMEDFVQLYWHTGEGFTQQNFSWAHYVSNEWVTVKLELEITNTTFYLRIDPSVRIGIIKIAYIKIFCRSTGRVMFNIHSKKAWRMVDLSGTAKWLKRKNRFCLIESFGNDPQLVLPVLTKNPVENRVDIEIKLKTMGYTQAMKSFCLEPISWLRLLKKKVSLSRVNSVKRS